MTAPRTPATPDVARPSAPSARSVLFVALGGPFAWAAHLSVSYAVIAGACTTGRPRIAALTIGIATVVLSLAALAAGYASYARWRRVGDAAAADGAARGGAVLWLVGAALGVLFAIVIVLGGIAPMVVPMCAAGGTT